MFTLLPTCLRGRPSKGPLASRNPHEGALARRRPGRAYYSSIHNCTLQGIHTPSSPSCARCPSSDAVCAVKRVPSPSSSLADAAAPPSSPARGPRPGLAGQRTSPTTAQDHTCSVKMCVTGASGRGEAGSLEGKVMAEGDGARGVSGGERLGGLKRLQWFEARCGRPWRGECGEGGLQRWWARSKAECGREGRVGRAGRAHGRLCRVVGCCGASMLG